MPSVRAPARLFAKVLALPPMFPETGARGRCHRGQQEQLVNSWVGELGQFAHSISHSFTNCREGCKTIHHPLADMNIQIVTHTIDMRIISDMIGQLSLYHNMK